MLEKYESQRDSTTEYDIMLLWQVATSLNIHDLQHIIINLLCLSTTI